MGPKHLEAGAGEVVRVLGEARIFKVTPDETGGTFLQFETSHGPGVSVPAHWHREEDEAFYVLSGHYEFRVGEMRFQATSGTFAFAPRGTIHAFTNTGREVARMLITVTPGTQHEGLFREVAELSERLGKPPEQSQLIGLASKYGWVMEASERSPHA